MSFVTMEDMKMSSNRFKSSFLQLIFTSVITVFLTLSSTSSPVYADNYTGAYFGAFPEFNSNGAFAMLVRIDNSAVLMAYDLLDDFGFIDENISISGTGDFSEPNIDGLGTNVYGTVTTTGVSGTYIRSGFSPETFSGDKSSLYGPYSDIDGYYKGTFVMNCWPYLYSGNGFFRTIVSADGNFFVYIQFTQSSLPGWPAGSKDGGYLYPSSEVTFYGTTFNGVMLSGILSGTETTGTISFDVCSGSFIGSLDYALTPPENTVPIGALMLLLL